jgi:hypothetical protein
MLLAVALVSSAKADTIIDSFNVPSGGSTFISTIDASMSSSGLPTSDVLGGTRTITHDIQVGAGELRTDVNVFVPGAAAISSSSNVDGQFIFSYATTGTDLSAENYFITKFLASDFPATLEITVVSGIGTGSASAAVPAGASIISIPFAAYSGVDFSNVLGIRVAIDGPVAHDATLDYIATAVPLPSSAWAGSALLAALGFMKARKMRD